jgi:hypothetical protein
LQGECQDSLTTCFEAGSRPEAITFREPLHDSLRAYLPPHVLPLARRLKARFHQRP